MDAPITLFSAKVTPTRIRKMTDKMAITNRRYFALDIVKPPVPDSILQNVEYVVNLKKLSLPNIYINFIVDKK